MSTNGVHISFVELALFFHFSHKNHAMPMWVPADRIQYVTWWHPTVKLLISQHPHLLLVQFVITLKTNYVVIAASIWCINDVELIKIHLTHFHSEQFYCLLWKVGFLVLLCTVHIVDIVSRRRRIGSFEKDIKRTRNLKKERNQICSSLKRGLSIIKCRDKVSNILLGMEFE